MESYATHGVVGLCLSVPDLAVSKLAAGRAGRDKDMEFVTALLHLGFLFPDDVALLAERLPACHRDLVLRNLRICQATQRHPA